MNPRVKSFLNKPPGELLTMDEFKKWCMEVNDCDVEYEGVDDFDPEIAYRFTGVEFAKKAIQTLIELGFGLPATAPQKEGE